MGEGSELVQVKRKRGDERKHVTGVQSEVDASREKMGGDSEIPQVKRSIVEQNKHFSGVESGVDASHEQLGGDSEGVNKNHDVSGVESGVDASHEQLGGDSERVNKKNDVSGVESGVDASHEQLGGDLERVKKKNDVSGVETGVNISSRQILSQMNRCNPTISSYDRNREYAKIAIKYYEKKKKAGKHEIIDVMFATRKSVLVPGYEDVREWCHVWFTAKPRNKGRRNTVRSPENFFGEIVLDHNSQTYNVVNCCAFKPSGAGLTYGCGFCRESRHNLHPAYAYVAGLPSSTYPSPLSDDYLAALESCAFDTLYK